MSLMVGLVINRTRRKISTKGGGVEIPLKIKLSGNVNFWLNGTENGNDYRDKNRKQVSAIALQIHEVVV